MLFGELRVCDRGANWAGGSRKNGGLLVSIGGKVGAFDEEPYSGRI